jgi:hypothetical protein
MAVTKYYFIPATTLTGLTLVPPPSGSGNTPEEAAIAAGLTQPGDYVAVPDLSFEIVTINVTPTAKRRPKP